ncbi:MAG: hypothetical protein ABJF04_06095 [Reichenbachiella sp.]|uniref:hypothetical protein n=1 Tax=Reichenbachiella sp. TaxID=2184521 RepID=UPI0032656406
MKAFLALFSILIFLSILFWVKQRDQSRELEDVKSKLDERRKRRDKELEIYQKLEVKNYEYSDRIKELEEALKICQTH